MCLHENKNCAYPLTFFEGKDRQITRATNGKDLSSSFCVFVFFWIFVISTICQAVDPTQIWLLNDLNFIKHLYQTYLKGMSWCVDMFSCRSSPKMSFKRCRISPIITGNTWVGVYFLLLKSDLGICDFLWILRSI